MFNQNDSGGPIKVLWGTGAYYKTCKEYIREVIKPDFIYDIKWEGKDISIFDGYKIISIDDIRNFKSCTIFLCILNYGEMDNISKREDLKNAYFKRLVDILPIERYLDKEEITVKDGLYNDWFGNQIIYSNKDLLNNIRIKFYGENATVKIGKNVRVFKNLTIECGENAQILIGDDTSFDDVILYSAFASVIIGNDCMFSYGIFIRNHDSHFIFDKKTGKRINYSRDIKIGNHVWVGQSCTLLPGFCIDDGSIVGAASVTSSHFGENVVIAGNPAKVIRENIFWDRKLTWTENYDDAEDLRLLNKHI